MKVTITITCDNDAFQPDPVPEVCRILWNLADIFDGAGLMPYIIRDVNGNVVGEANIIK